MTDDTERRRGMDDVAKAIGQLEAGLSALARQLDSIQVQRQAQHVEGIRSMSDIQAQIHEIKHAQNNDGMKFAGLKQQVESIKEGQQRDHDAMMRELATQQHTLKENSEGLERQIIANRDQAAAREATILTRLDEIGAWRNKILGGVAILLFLTATFGEKIWEGVKHMLPGGGR